MKKLDADRAIRQLAMRQGKKVEEIRTQIKLAMAAGMCSQDPKVQARWKMIPHRGKAPTPEELIEYLATHVDAGIDPFV